jgi:hypothetical protein
MKKIVTASRAKTVAKWVSVGNRCPWVGRRHSEVTGQLQEKGTSNMGEGCGEWIQFGETVTYDPCPPGLADGN